VGGLQMALDDMVVTILKEHEDKFSVTSGLEKAFGRPIRTVILEEKTRSQSETVARTVEKLQLDEPFFVKDSDGVFHLDDLNQEDNYICVDSLNNFDSINPRNKSYLQIDHKGIVTNIREKVVISDLFNVGGYYFTAPAQFLEFYERLSRDKASWNREIYLSDVIGAMILEGIPFRARQTTGFKDWGTVREWRRALLAQKAFFVLLDGFVLERGSEFFRPRFQDVKPQPAAVEAVKALVADGHKVVYLSIRPASLEALTRKQLEAAGLTADTILWNCPIAKWVLLTSPHATLPFLTSQALELHSDDVNLVETIHGDVALN
jgi:dTDP-glucose pyrophosphorylase